MAGGGFDPRFWVEDDSGTACLAPPSSLCSCQAWQPGNFLSALQKFVAGDAREYGGKRYVCTAEHTPLSDFFSELGSWQLDSGTGCCSSCAGQCRPWNRTTHYHVGDYVVNSTGAASAAFVCAQEHVSATAFNASFWTKDSSSTACCSAAATSSCQCKPWANSTKYRRGDTVSIFGAPYICKAGHVSSISAGSSGGSTDNRRAAQVPSTFPTATEISQYWDRDSGTGCCNSTGAVGNVCPQWLPSVRYHVGDYVTVSSSSSSAASANQAFVCTAEHVSASSFNAAMWQADDGDAACAADAPCAGACVDWRPSTYYWPGDAVNFGGVSYSCRSVHVSSSGFSSDKSTYWYQDSGTACCNSTVRPTCDSWQSSTVYHVGDYVGRSNKAYVCTSEHTSSSFSSDSAKWAQDTTRIACAAPPPCKGSCPAWQPSTRYRAGDRSSYNGTAYSCKASHVSSPTSTAFSSTDLKYWTLDSGSGCCNATNASACLPWSPATRFHVGDSVALNNSLYVCTGEHLSTSNLANDISQWRLDSSDRLCRPGCTCPDWKSGAEYAAGDLRVYNGITQRCTSAHTSWDTFAQDKWERDSGKGCCFVPCECGKYCPKWSASSLTCPPGKYCPANSSTPLPCPAGSYCGGGTCLPTLCACGSKCPPRSSAPTPCRPPYYCPSNGSSTQTLCPTGYYCPNPGMCAPLQCPLGTWVSCAGKVRCDNCTAGRYCPNVTSTQLCPAGSYCPALSWRTTPCPAGSYCTVGASAPRLCPPGFFCKAGASTKTLCTNGTYQDSSNQTACKSCQSAKTAGATACVQGSRRLLEQSEAAAGTAEGGPRAAGGQLGAVDAAAYSAGTLVVLLASALVMRRVVKSHRVDRESKAEAVTAVLK